MQFLGPVARHFVLVHDAELRAFGAAAVLGEGAAVGEDATGAYFEGRDRSSWDGPQPLDVHRARAGGEQARGVGGAGWGSRETLDVTLVGIFPDPGVA